jgi:protein N-terminal amidase
MAWLTHESASSFRKVLEDPDMVTLSYWLIRLEPVRKARSLDEIIIVFANRTGVEDEVVYAGTSAVVGIKGEEITLYGLLGRGEEELLVVDTSKPRGKLTFKPQPADDDRLT